VWTIRRHRAVIRRRRGSIEASEDNAIVHLIVRDRHDVISVISMTDSDATNVHDNDPDLAIDQTECVICHEAEK
jgi:hypothetical protein